jgi:hypothetical protein
MDKLLATKTGAQRVMHTAATAPCVDKRLQDGDTLELPQAGAEEGEDAASRLSRGCPSLPSMCGVPMRRWRGHAACLGMPAQAALP